MRLLAVGDVVDPVLYDEFDRARWSQDPVDAVVSCGDLPGDYLTSLADHFHCPLFYVRGNHDGSYTYQPPARCTAIDGRLLRWQGLRLLGLGGAPPHNGGSEQHSERAMAWRWRRHTLGIRRLGGLDLVVTHAPPRFAGLEAPPRISAPGLADTRHISRLLPPTTWPDPGHRGFQALARLIRHYRPRVLLHGHTHLAYGTGGREYIVEGTRIINVYGHYLLEIGE